MVSSVDEIIRRLNRRTLEKNVEWAKYRQYAGIIIDGVLLVMRMWNIYVDVSEVTMEKIFKDTAEAVQRCIELQAAVQNLCEKWVNTKSTLWDKSEAVWELIYRTNTVGCLGHIIRGLYYNRTHYDQLITAITVTAYLLVPVGRPSLPKYFLLLFQLTTC